MSQDTPTISASLTVPAWAEARPPSKPEPAKSAVDAILIMIEKAANAGQIETLERLMKWRDAQLAREAELVFNDALAAAEKGMTRVQADSVNKHTGGSHYASLAAMDEAVREVYTAHGFGLTFDTEDIQKPETVRLICDVSHRAGHTRRYHIDMPADGKGAKGGDVMTRTHATGSAITYGRRYLLGMIFNITVARGDDDDGNAAGRRPQRQTETQGDRPIPTFEDLQSAASFQRAMSPPVQAMHPKHRVEAPFHPPPEDVRPMQRKGPACKRCLGTGVFRRGKFEGPCFHCQGDNGGRR